MISGREPTAMPRASSKPPSTTRATFDHRTINIVVVALERFLGIPTARRMKHAGHRPRCLDRLGSYLMIIRFPIVKIVHVLHACGCPIVGRFRAATEPESDSHASRRRSGDQFCIYVA